MITGIDHIVIMVSDLETATRQWSAVGFNVIPGGKHPRGTHNALIAFQDGSYLELIAFWEPDYDAHKWHRFRDTGIGLIDHALGSSDLAAEVVALADRGIRYDGPNPGARSRPDGVELAWRTAQPAGYDDHGLPFLIDDVSDRSLRVPGGSDAMQENGVIGVKQLQIVAADYEGVANHYAKITGTEPASGDDGSALVTAGPHSIKISTPDAGSAGSMRIDTFGDGPYSLTFTGAESFEVDPNDVDGARIRCESS